MDRATMPSMRAALLHTPEPIENHPLRVEQTKIPTPGPGQLVIRVRACGVCRSNLHMIEGDWVAGGVPAREPIIPGHEVTGHVAIVGEGVETFHTGDAVGVQPLWWSCDECDACRSGHEFLCRKRLITGEHVDGGYAEFMLANAAHTYGIPAGLDLADAAPLFCPGITAYSAVEKAAIRPGDSVFIFGMGGVGHMAVQFAKLAGAHVIAVSRNAEHLSIAQELGADEVVTPSDLRHQAFRRNSADSVITFAGSDDITQLATEVLAWGGTLVNCVPISLDEFPFNKEQTIKASLLGSRVQMRRVLELASQGKIRTVTARFELGEAETALRRLKFGELPSRAVVVCSAG